MRRSLDPEGGERRGGVCLDPAEGESPRLQHQDLVIEVAGGELERLPDIVVLQLGVFLPKKVRAAREAILDAPENGKALKDELAGLRSYRLGNLRIVYRLAKSRVIELVAVGPRRHIYEDTYRRVRRGAP